MHESPTHVTAPHFPAGRRRQGAFTRAAALVRRMIGAPDYEAYLRHAATCHPDRAPMSEAEFHEDRLRARYSTVGNRCC